jgi:hypothetical protein
LVSAHWRRPRRSVVALVVIFLGVFAAVPSAVANGGSGQRSNVQHFIGLSTDPSNMNAFIIATGPIHARGTDVTVSGTRDRFKFPRGTLFITHRAGKPATNRFDKVTCYFTFTERGTYRVTGGTGAYAHASGNGRYSLKGSGIACDQKAPPTVFTIEIRASGPLRF